MSAHESNILNQTNSVNTNPNRNEFTGDNRENDNNSKLKENIPKGRWNQLYIKSQAKKVKDENLRKQAIEKRESEMLTECTFQPQLTKVPKYLKYNGLLTFQNADNIPLIEQRNKAWLIKKTDKINHIKNYEITKSLNECYFKPKIVSEISLKYI